MSYRAEVNNFLAALDSIQARSGSVQSRTGSYRAVPGQRVTVSRVEQPSLPAAADFGIDIATDDQGERRDVQQALANIAKRSPLSFQKMQRVCNRIIVRDMEDMGQCRPILQLLGDRAVVVRSGMSVSDLEETIVHEILGHQALGPLAAWFGEGHAEDIEERYWAGELP
jgi:hypothetical protein